MIVIVRMAAVGLIVALAACNTVQGFGKDVKDGGEAITGTAQNVHEQI